VADPVTGAAPPPPAKGKPGQGGKIDGKTLKIGAAALGAGLLFFWWRSRHPAAAATTGAATAAPGADSTTFSIMTTPGFHRWQHDHHQHAPGPVDKPHPRRPPPKRRKRKPPARPKGGGPHGPEPHRQPKRGKGPHQPGRLIGGGGGLEHPGG
jgi:hypothetical protein